MTEKMSNKKHISGGTNHPRQRRTVLSEEEYTSTLNDIVQREYFPDLPSLRRQAAVLEKRAQGDFPGAVAVRRAARQLEEHEELLAAEELEAEQNVDAANVRKTPRPLHRESLSGFHARVTSEDNAEFDATQRQEVQANRARLQQVFSLQITNGPTKRGSETPLLASDKFNPSPHRISATEWKDNETGSNGLFFNPQHYVGGSSEPIQKKLLLTNGKDASSTENQLMPPPAPVKRPSDTSSTLVLKQDMVEYIPKHQIEKRIDPSKTRFPVQISLPPQRPHVTSGDSSTDYSTEASTDLDSPALPLSVERQARVKRQRREQETLVSMTPQIVPGRSAGNESPIVTWGKVSATPMVLGGVNNVSETSFRLPAENDREYAARRVEQTFEKARRKSKQRPRQTLTTPMDQMTASLTPAARSLLNKSSTRQSSSSVRSSGAFGSALRSSYTPKRSATTSVRRDIAGKATPRVQSGSKRTVDTTPADGNITDGLLNLPKKQSTT